MKHPYIGVTIHRRYDLMVPDMCVFQVAEVPMNGYIYVTDKLQIDFDEDIL